ncbi:MAG: aminotransferase class I/II-fold pyridoxal phosphate-dependent enzyme [Rhizobiales bacterium]|nr:aminotransferase class I/II-fold pyridoxal phosphate-dependent enzyme [Hyphomicrobiales bacterium]
MEKPNSENRKIFLSPPDISGRERVLVDEVFDSNFIAPAGEMLTRFENDMCAYTGIKHAVALSSGTAALHLALRIAGIGPGDEVWTSSMTFIGGASPIIYLGAVPVFFDLSPDSWTIDCDLLEENLKEAAHSGKLPKAIVPTDLYGQSCDLDRLVDLSAQFDVPIIADSAEALGAFFKGRHAGKGTHSAILSFNGNKIITTSGGGMLLSDDPKTIEYARKLSTQAREPVVHYEHTEIGYNYRMSNVCAAIGVGQLEQIEEKITKRRAIFERYVEAFSKFQGVGFMPEPKDRRSSRWLTCLTIDPDMQDARLDNILSVCDAAQIEVRPLWKPMHMQPVFANTRFVGSGFCERLFATGLCLPSGSALSGQDQDRVIDIITGALRVSG